VPVDPVSQQRAPHPHVEADRSRWSDEGPYATAPAQAVAEACHGVAAVAQDGHVEEATWPTSGRMARCTLLLLDKRVRWMLGDAGTGLGGNYAATRCRP
jgi:hypothetical protein